MTDTHTSCSTISIYTTIPTNTNIRNSNSTTNITSADSNKMITANAAHYDANDTPPVALPCLSPATEASQHEALQSKIVFKRGLISSKVQALESTAPLVTEEFPSYVLKASTTKVSMLPSGVHFAPKTLMDVKTMPPVEFSHCNSSSMSLRDFNAPPRKIFDRHTTLLPNAQIINYQVSPDETLGPLGRVRAGANGQVKGNMPMYSIAKNVPQLLQGYTAAFAKVLLNGCDDPAPLLCFHENMPDAPNHKFCIREVFQDEEPADAIFQFAQRHAVYQNSRSLIVADVCCQLMCG
jgi:hypothetical protein